MLKKFQASGIKLTTLLPLSHRSHDAVAELMESKVWDQGVRVTK